VAVFEAVRDHNAELIAIRQIAIDADGNGWLLLRVPRVRARTVDGRSHRSDRSTPRLLYVEMRDRLGSFGVRTRRGVTQDLRASLARGQAAARSPATRCPNRDRREDPRSTFGWAARSVASLSLPLPWYPADRRALTSLDGYGAALGCPASWRPSTSLLSLDVLARQNDGPRRSGMPDARRIGQAKGRQELLTIAGWPRSGSTIELADR
jgi:hypothetical protein